MNTRTNTIGINSASFNPAIMGEATTFSFSITPSIPMTINGQILITFPAEFVLGTTSCTLPTGFSCLKTGSVITISITATPSFPISGSISGITAPRISESSGIYIQTFGADGAEMTRDSTVTFKVGCNLYCRTCTSDPSYCLTCYTDTVLASGHVLGPTDGKCLSFCPVGQY